MMFTLPFVIGHRGLSGLAPENSLGALKLAASLGVKAVEFDVQIASCGTPIVFHDETLDRLTGQSGFVYDKPYARLSQLPLLGTIERIPSLSDYLKLAFDLDLLINLEIKPRNDYDCDTALAILAFLDVHLTPAQYEKCLVSSFHHESLYLARASKPGLAIALLYEALSADCLSVATELEADAIHLSDAHVTSEEVRTIRDAGYQCAVYTVNDCNRAKTLASFGVNAIFTDHPEYAFA